MNIEDLIKAVRSVWEIVNAELGRVLAPLLVVQDSELVLGNDQYTVYFGGDWKDARTLEFRAKAGNQTLIFCGFTVAQVGRIIHCLYQLAGARLRP